MTGNPHAVGAVCGFRPESDDERYIRAVALRWLGGRSIQLLDRVVSSLPDSDKAVLIDVLWNARSVGAPVVRRHAESLLVGYLLAESWNYPRPSVTEGLQRHDRLRLAVRAAFDELMWPPKECTIACWGRWPGRDALTWSESELRNAIRNGPSHEPARDELIRYHELNPKRAYDLTLDILRNGYRSTSGLPDLLVYFDTEQAVRDLWEICTEADIRLRHEIAVKLDEVEPRYLVEQWLFDKMLAGRPADRRMAAWLLGWQTDRLLHEELRTRLDADVDASSQILKALERQHTAHEALQLLLDLPGQEPHARLIRVELFCELCKPTDKASPDGWAIWRRAGHPRLGAPLWERMKEKLRGIRKFNEESRPR